MKELQNIIDPDKPREITPQTIIEIVCEHFSVTLDQMTGKSRSNDISRPRQIAMYLCKTLTECSLEVIGSFLGGRNHSTIIHGVQKIADEYEIDQDLKSQIDVIKKKIRPS
jgi:chromosomal replication initiator protein